MAVAKSIELIAEGNTIEEATENAVREAAQTVDHIQEVYVDDYRARVENGEIQTYRVRAQVTFVLEDQ